MPTFAVPPGLVLALILLGALVAVYLMIIRPFLKSRPELAKVLAQIDDRGAGIGRLFWHYLQGFRTILFARFLQISGALLTLLDRAGQIDMATVLRDKAWMAPLIVLAIGLAAEGLRHITTGPVPTKAADAIEEPKAAPAAAVPAPAA